MNIVILRGTLSRAPELRALATGAAHLQLDLSTPLLNGVASVPVIWVDPPARAQFEAGDQVVVAGSVRRRFFRVGGITQSRTEVVADLVVPVGQRKAVQRVLATAKAALDGA